MSYLYRPMSLLPLIGHDALRARFEDQIVRGTLPASILLQGPPGIGKQRLALWLGQRLLCSGTGPVLPCGECQHCRYTLDGVHPDLRWYFPMLKVRFGATPPLDDVDAECRAAVGERIVEHGLYPHPDGSHGIFVFISRLIVQQAVSTPAMAKRKVFVVGDADRMVPQAANPDAANAFLKLLEEPPADTTLILTTSEPGALLPTIRSRVVAFRVAPLIDTEVRSWLAQPPAADAAGKGAMESLVRLAGGAPGSLIGAADRTAVIERAQALLAAASGGRERALRAAFTQGSSKARGAFTDVLDALTVLLHEQVELAVADGNADKATASAKAVRLVEEAKRAAEGNAIPQLVTAQLLRDLAEAGV
jgi:DNA polymerase-3 subunit delta'